MLLSWVSMTSTAPSQVSSISQNDITQDSCFPASKTQLEEGKRAMLLIPPQALFFSLQEYLLQAQYFIHWPVQHFSWKDLFIWKADLLRDKSAGSLYTWLQQQGWTRLTRSLEASPDLPCVEGTGAPRSSSGVHIRRELGQKCTVRLKLVLLCGMLVLQAEAYCVLCVVWHLLLTRCNNLYPYCFPHSLYRSLCQSL